MKMMPKLSFADTQIIMQACIEEAHNMGVDMDIAITDDGGHLLAFQRMDNARVTSINISQDKAFTAAAARKSTRAYGEVSGVNKPAFGINTSNQGRFSIIAGGVPLFYQDMIVGGIGCSSGTPDQDEQVAMAGVRAFEEQICAPQNTVALAANA